MRELEHIAVFVFYSIATGKQAWMGFSDEFKHCNVIIFDGRNWIMLDMDSRGFVLRKVLCNNGDHLIRTLPKLEKVSAVVAVAVNEIKPKRWMPFMVNSCNEICRKAAGVDIGFTFNPVHLYNKLLEYDKQANYTILSAWRRQKWDSSVAATTIEKPKQPTND